MDIYKLVEFLVSLLCVLTAVLYTDLFRDDKKSVSWAMGASLAAYTCFQLWGVFAENRLPIVTLAADILIVFFICLSAGSGGILVAIFRAVVFCAAGMITEVAVNFVLVKTGIAAMTYGDAAGYASSCVLFYISIRLLKRLKSDETHYAVPFRQWLKLSIIPATAVYVVHIVYSRTHPEQRDGSFLIIVLLMLLADYIAFEMYDRIGRELDIQKRSLAYKRQLDMCNKQSEEREAAYRDTMEVRHDLNGYLLDLKAAMQSGNREEAERKIDNLLMKNRIYKDEISRSGNIVIDSALNHWGASAQEKEITVDCRVDVEENLPYDGADICVILANLLDNAVEAVEELPFDDRYVSVRVFTVKGSLKISVENPYNGEILTDKEDRIITKKSDHENHGIGLASVRRIVKSYNGELSIDYKEGLFKVNVLLYSNKILHADD